MRNASFLHVVAGVLLLSTFVSPAADLQGTFSFSGKGALTLTFDGAGGFSGVGACGFSAPGFDPPTGVVTITGTTATPNGYYEMRDRSSGSLVDSGSAIAISTVQGVKLYLGLRKFTGIRATGALNVPAGLFAAPLPPVEVLYQCIPSGDPHVITLQGDQDFFIDLNRALGGQFVFDNRGRGFGVVYENSDPAGLQHYATMRYKRNGKLALRVYDEMRGNKSRAIRLSSVNSGGNYDGVYNMIVTPDGCASQTLKLTVKNDVVSGSDASTGALSGIVDFTGSISFTSQKFTVADTACAQAGTHTGTITFTGAASSAGFPQIFSGTFSGAGTQGTFVLNQPVGVTGATSPTAPRQEIWSGTLTGTHVSEFCPGGKWNESYTLRLTFPSDVIAALRGGSILTSGSGTMSGSETVVTQPPAQQQCTYIANTLADTAVNVVFAGNLSPNGPVIDLQAGSVLIPSTVHSTFVTPEDKSENRSSFRLKVKHINSTQLKGEWPFGTFVLKKQ